MHAINWYAGGDQAIDIQPHAREITRLLRSMSSKKRLLILWQLMDGERSVTDLANSLAIRRTTVSQHLARLLQDGIVLRRRAAQVRYYRLASEEARALLQGISTIYIGSGER